MPCSDGYDRPPPALEFARKDIDKLTRLLCGACKELSTEQIEKVEGLAHWWKRHQEADARRIEREVKLKKMRYKQAKIKLREAKSELKALQEKE